MMRKSRHNLWLMLALAGGILAACTDDPTGPDIPGTPAGLQAAAAGPRTVTLSWQAVAGAETYIVERSPGAGGDYHELARVAATQYQDTDVEPQTSYRYRVAAVSGTETGPFTAPEVVATTNLPVSTITGDVTTDRRLHADTIYQLGSWVHVANGATLTIDAGTRIEGLPGTALFVLRGASIEAVGTAASPIVFTSSRPVDQRQPGDWGGLIIVGNGVLNRGPSVILEGTNTAGGSVPGTNYAIDYAGGTDNTDSSGRLEYVRIEFAGFGPAQDQELNSLTMAAVGSGTQVQYVQTLAGLDDSFEWFGGAVDGKYLISYEAGDDHFDASEGYVGRNQFLIAYQSTFLTPRPGTGNLSTDPQGIENDGCSGSNCFSGQNSDPFNIPVFANFTLIGAAVGTVSTPSGGGRGMMLRRGTGGFYVNGVIARWPNAAIVLRDEATESRINNGDLVLSNVLAVQNGALFEPDNPASSTRHYEVDAEDNAIVAGAGTAADLFVSLSSSGEVGPDWTLTASAAAATGGLDTFTGDLLDRAGTFITPTAYRGAISPTGPKWWEGWTYYAQN